MGPRKKVTAPAGRQKVRLQQVNLEFASTTEEIRRFPCATAEHAGKTMILFAAPASVLWAAFRINRKEEDKDRGYQRALTHSRVETIAEFIRGGGMLPTGIVVALNSDVVVESGQVVIPATDDAGWVIDGQHRLAGARTSKTEIVLPVVGFLGMSITDQINAFITINREQKGVPTSLYYELLKHLPGQRTEVEAIQMSATDLATALKTDEASPFYAKIVSISQPKRGRELSLTNFIRKLAPFLRKSSGALCTYSFEERVRILNSYYRAVSLAYPDEFESEDSPFFKTLGFGALMNVLPHFMDKAIRLKGGLQLEDFEYLWRKVKAGGYTFDDIRATGTGSTYEAKIADGLRAALNLALADESNASPKIRI